MFSLFKYLSNFNKSLIFLNNLNYKNKSQCYKKLNDLCFRTFFQNLLEKKSTKILKGFFSLRRIAIIKKKWTSNILDYNLEPNLKGERIRKLIFHFQEGERKGVK